MFKLVVAIFVVINGEPSERPTKAFAYTADFETEQACMDYAKSEDSVAIRSAVKEFVQSQRGAITARLGCTLAEDNTI